MSPLWIVVIALATATLGVLGNVVGGWLKKPDGMSGGHVVAVLIVLVLATAGVALVADGKAPWPKSGDSTTAKPTTARSNPAVATPSRSTPAPGKTSRATRKPTARTTRPRSTTTAPKSVDLSGDLDGSISPWTLVHDGRVKTLKVTVSQATPNGKLPWQYGSLIDGSRPACTMDFSSLCNDQFGGGVATADSKGVAVFTIRWSPGDAYDALGDGYDDAGWAVNVIDDATYGSSKRSCRCISIGFMVQPSSDAPASTEWEH
ncbi:hypothetical protein JIG36_44185 [Actinoplanes sp. LDG1-06]|uniref:Uncharacterized protein n=1 Tax=Paractinoplanes ovalisporus TaxID=2810368 RepID=A0ABS2ARS3_9ACTN|nr:hypothetical protein [Actinoplanes ovalisporus]MBM2622524.1 hypothetical protein [Actinoplanes ovalisporus]